MSESGLGPPKLAPEGVPQPVARYLDNAAAYLKPVAKKARLKLSTYDVSIPEQHTWCHHLYGKCRDRGFAIQVASNLEGAPHFQAVVTGFVEVLERGGSEWLQIESRSANGMDAMLRAVEALQASLRTLCTFAMPHITDPDPRT